jgi:hypothetical protein
MTEARALFYTQIRPVNRKQHGGWSIDPRAGFAFARHTNSVPLMTVEFPLVAQEYPIVFVKGDDGVLPVAVLGLKDRQNLFIGETGDWDARYVPAYVRRYPFIYATSDGGKTFALCIDEGFAGCNQDGEGERLFLEDGSHSPYLERVLAFLRQYEAQYRNTRAFGERIHDLGLLEEAQAHVALTSGGKLALGGLWTVARDKLRGLKTKDLKALMEGDALELLYVHLLSLGNFSKLVDRLAKHR